MPVVPRYDNPTVNVAPIATPQATAVGPDAFGAGLGRGLGQLAGDFSAIGQETQRQNDVETAQKFQAFAGQVGVETSNKILSTEGEAALKSKDNPAGMTPILDDYDKQISDWIQKNSSDGRQSSALMNVAQEYRNGVEKTMLSHELGQRKVVQEQAFQGAQSTIFDTLSVTAADPNRQTDYDRAYEQGFANVDAYAIAHNLAEEQHQALLDDFEQKATLIKAKQMMHVNPVEAKNFIEENKDILGTDYTNLKESVQLVASEQKGINAAEALSGLLNKEDYTTLRAKLFKQFDGGTDQFDHKAFKVAEAQLRGNLAAVKEDISERVSGLGAKLESARSDAIANGQTMTPKQLTAMPEYQALINDGSKEALHEATRIMSVVRSEYKSDLREARAEARADRADARMALAERKQAQAEWTAAHDDPDLLLNAADSDIRALAPQIGYNNVNMLLKKKRQYLKDSAALDKAQIDKDILVTEMSSAGMTYQLNPSKVKTEDYKNTMQLKSRVEQLTRYEQQQTGKPVTPERQREIIRDQMLKVTVPGRFWGTNEEPQFKVRPLDFQIPGASSEDVGMVVTRFAQRGIVPTYSMVQRGVQLLKGGSR